MLIFGEQEGHNDTGDLSGEHMFLVKMAELPDSRSD